MLRRFAGVRFVEYGCHHEKNMELTNHEEYLGMKKTGLVRGTRSEFFDSGHLLELGKRGLFGKHMICTLSE